MLHNVQGKRIRGLVQTGMIAAGYVALTFISASFGMAYTGVQLRLSEVLMVLPIISPGAIPALTVGCFVSNMASPFGFLDMIIGTLSTFLSAVLIRAFRHIRLFRVPVVSLLAPVVVGPILIGCMISFSSVFGFSFAVFWPVAIGVAVSEFITCFVLGIPLLIFLEKRGINEILKGDFKIGEK